MFYDVKPVPDFDDNEVVDESEYDYSAPFVSSSQ